MDRMGPTDVRDAGFGKSEEAHLPRLDQISDSAGDLFDWHCPIDTMLIEQIDVVGLEPAQASLNRFANVLGAAVHADDPVALETRSELRGDHNLMATSLACPAKKLLVGKRAVTLRGCNEVTTRQDGERQCGD